MTASSFSALIIDDTAAVRSYLRQILNALGVGNVLEAPTGREGEALFVAHHPTMVFLDIQLPDSNGRHLLRQFKLMQPSCEVFMCSAYSSVENLKDTIVGGADGFIIKPFASERIQQLVKPVLKAKGIAFPN